MRTYISKLAFTAAIGVALALASGCSSDDSSSPSNEAGLSSLGNSSSSSSYSSSSTPSSSSSSSYDIDGSYTVNSISDYRTVQIGGQVWMAENLNYYVPGSECYSDCATYGRFYNWATAMALPNNCNSSNCSSQINAKHQGICPSGWHIPSNAEWDDLYRFVDGTSGTESPYSSPTAGKYLKATSGWNNGGEGNGEDTYGFSALPGGKGDPDGDFNSAGYLGTWWSTSVIDDESAYCRIMIFNNEGAVCCPNSKLGLHNVRCVKDNDSDTYQSSSSSSDSPSSSSVPSSSSSARSYNPPNYINTYKIVAIGTQTWMAENLNYNTAGSVCYGNPDSCDTYGRLYDWATAMGFESSCNYNSCSSLIQAKHQGICPTGWHIPTYDEWSTLSSYVQNDSGCSDCDGTLLKATSGWSSSGNGTDAYGFTALPGGSRNSNGNSIVVGNGGHGVWWNTSEVNDSNASSRYLFYGYESAYWYEKDKADFHSVRCIKD